MHPTTKIAIAVLFVSFAAAVAPAQSDPQATPETKRLFNYLRDISGKSILIGQQFPGLHAQQGEKGDRCDFFDSAGAYPAIWGCNWEMGQKNRPEMLKAYSHHAINTMYWLMPNPVTGAKANEKPHGDKPVASILPGGAKHDAYCRDLDELADFFLSLKDPAGRPIPVLMRLFHENSGKWYWWGSETCTPEQYKSLFRFTVKYLRDKKGVHQLLYVYAPDRPSENENYTVRYPGDEVVDVLGFDNYNVPGKDFRKSVVADCRIVAEMARNRGKISALAETGFYKGLQNATDRNWFTHDLVGPIQNDPVARQISYILTWSNFSPKFYWIPVKGQPNFDDFVKMTHLSGIGLADKLPADLFHGN